MRDFGGEERLKVVVEKISRFSLVVVASAGSNEHEVLKIFTFQAQQ